MGRWELHSIAKRFRRRVRVSRRQRLVCRQRTAAIVGAQTMLPEKLLFFSYALYAPLFHVKRGIGRGSRLHRWPGQKLLHLYSSSRQRAARVAANALLPEQSGFFSDACYSPLLNVSRDIGEGRLIRGLSLGANLEDSAERIEVRLDVLGRLEGQRRSRCRCCLRPERGRCAARYLNLRLKHVDHLLLLELIPHLLELEFVDLACGILELLLLRWASPLDLFDRFVGGPAHIVVLLLLGHLLQRAEVAMS
mmetsp:Transcript_30809/g.67264  ORF Transcript_30809/g.67264 Transcript_30809/m.67264 type:complete len:250 (-) Transcript_30809:410-1159(-)